MTTKCVGNGKIQIKSGVQGAVMYPCWLLKYTMVGSDDNIRGSWTKGLLGLSVLSSNFSVNLKLFQNTKGLTWGKTHSFIKLLYA